MDRYNKRYQDEEDVGFENDPMMEKLLNNAREDREVVSPDSEQNNNLFNENIFNQNETKDEKKEKDSRSSFFDALKERFLQPVINAPVQDEKLPSPKPLTPSMGANAEMDDEQRANMLKFNNLKSLMKK